MDLKIGERIRVHRLMNKMSRTDLAQLVGASSSSIAMYERGEREPSVDMLKLIAARFNVSLDYLCGYLPVSSEVRFLGAVDMSDHMLMSNFRFVVDGRELSAQEVRFLVSSVRSLRDLVDSKDGD